jgi:hypothetical protein
MGEGIPLSHALLPLPPVAKVMGKTFRYVHPTGVTQINFLSVCFALLVCLVTQVLGSPLPAEGL